MSRDPQRQASAASPVSSGGAARFLYEAQRLAGVGCYDFDATSGLWTSSVVMDEIFGIGPDYPRTVAGWLDLVHSDERAAMRDYLLGEVLGKGRPFEREYRIQPHGTDAIRWVHGRGQLEWDATGRLVRMIGTIQDITERRLAAEALTTSEQTYREIFNATSDALFVHGLDGTLIDVNSRMCEMYGCTREEALRMGPDELSLGQAPYDGPHAMRWLRRALEEGPQLLTWHARRRDGTLFWTEVGLRACHIAGQRRVLASVRDITASRSNELALAESTKRLQLAMDAAEFAVWEWDILTDRLSWDERMHAIYGTDPAGPPLGYTDWLNAVHPDDREQAVASAKATLEGSRVYDAEFRIRRPDGVTVVVKSDGVVLRDSAGRATRVVGFNRDITALRRLEERLRQSEKMQAIGQLAGGVAHNFNNQLACILGYADMIIEAADDRHRTRHARQILAAAQRAADLTAQLLAFSRKGQRINVAVDLHQLIRETAMLLGQSIDRRISIEQRLEAAEATVCGDPTQLQSMLLNLALNARDAMPEGGQLRFVTCNVRPTTVEAEALGLTAVRHLQVEVSDSGMGMTTETQRHIFEPFFTTKETGKGTGLGMASAHGTVLGHKGSITVRSQQGQGSTFTILLPVHAAGPSPDPAEAAAAPVRVPDGLRVMLADDDANVLDLGSEMLVRCGCQVTTCVDGADAVARYRRDWHSIDVVILDVVMPRMGGGEAFAELRRINPAARVIVTSGYSIDGVVQGILDAGAIAFIQKPFVLQDLARKLAEVKV